jgi:hypothetical protein
VLGYPIGGRGPVEPAANLVAKACAMADFVVEEEPTQEHLDELLSRLTCEQALEVDWCNREFCGYLNSRLKWSWTDRQQTGYSPGQSVLPDPPLVSWLMSTFDANLDC